MTKQDKPEEKPKMPTKMIQVHPELYQYLILAKGGYILKLGRDVTFADVIAFEINESNYAKQVLSLLVRNHPEVKPFIEEAARHFGQEHLDLVEPILSVIGKPKQEKKE